MKDKVSRSKWYQVEDDIWYRYIDILNKLLKFESDQVTRSRDFVGMNFENVIMRKRVYSVLSIVYI